MAKQNWPINGIDIRHTLHERHYVLYPARDLMLVTSGSTFSATLFIFHNHGVQFETMGLIYTGSIEIPGKWVMFT